MTDTELKPCCVGAVADYLLHLQQLEEIQDGLALFCKECLGRIVYRAREVPFWRNEEP